MIRELTEQDEGVEIHVQCLAEDIHPRGQFATGDAEEDERTVQQILSDLEWNEWAWCCIKVWATWQGIAGEPEHLGCCSYGSKKDFIETNDYFADMKAVALKSLNEVVRDLHGKMEALRVQDP